jgi:hypothetical protein
MTLLACPSSVGVWEICQHSCPRKECPLSIEIFEEGALSQCGKPFDSPGYEGVEGIRYDVG